MRHYTRHIRAILLACALVFAAACGAGSEDAPAVDADAVMPEWTLSPRPVVSLGGSDAGPEHELYQVMFALRLDDGRIVVANQGTTELRFYGPDGVHLKTVGRAGEGPGEFRDMWGLVRLRGDSLAAWDWRLKRLTIFDPDGELARVVTPVDVGVFFPRMLGTLQDGDGVILTAGFNPGDALSGGQGVRQDSVTLLRLALAGAVTDTLGPFPGAQQYVELGAGSLFLRPVPFGIREHVAIGGDNIFVGNDRTGDIHVHAGDGRPVRVIRTGLPTRTVTAADVARFRREELADVPPERLDEERARLEKLPAAERTPAFTTLFADRLGRVWIAPFTDDRAAPRSWLVFGADGAPRGRIQLPHGARPVDAGESHLLLHSRDELHVERLALHGMGPG